MKKIVFTFMLICSVLLLFSDAALTDTILKKALIAATSLDSYKSSYRLAATRDQVGLAEMLGENKIVYLPAGAKISIIGSTRVFGHVVNQVKLIDVNVEGYLKHYMSEQVLRVEGAKVD